tara:strand:- start:88 stop:369 length:282 start_codon:yes stop_codon:yes gene_type:complete
MSKQAPTEVRLLEIWEYLEKVLSDGSTISIDSMLKLLSRDILPIHSNSKSKGNDQVQKPNNMNVEAIIKRGMMCLLNNYFLYADNSKIMGKQL